MNWRKIEDRLFKHLLFQRIILGVSVIVSIVCAIVYYNLFINSKEVIVHGTYITWEEVKYNYDYAITFPLCIIAALFLTFFLICNLIYCKFTSVELGSKVVTVYRGLFISRLFVSGEKIGTIWAFSPAYFIETELSNKLTINVKFIHNRRVPIAHISFSDNTPSIYI